MPERTLTADRWREIFRLFDAGLELEPDARAGWLASLDGDGAVLAPWVETLLRRHAAHDTTDFMRDPATFALRDGNPGSSGTVAGEQTVGPYRLLRQIGQGGMATVWLAERSDGLIARRVALKLPHAVGFGPGSFADRFRREREMLAALRHPNIACLLDAGFADDGQPYLALEYVDGLPLTRYASEHRLDIEARLALFAQVLDAVAHAHDALVLHRDLKPSNILVTPEGEVKLLDFGIAKLLQDGETAETTLTRLAGAALTPDYSAPEQIAGSPLTTAADVYALGVVLCELLCGARPYRLKRGSRAELEEAIAEADAVAPSHAAISEQTAAERATTVRRLRRALTGDLDAIVLKALRKQPAERYGGVRALADDIARHLAGAPVLAQPDRLAYRCIKFIRRHRVGVGVGGVTAAALLAATLISVDQAHRAGIEARRADASKEFLVGLFRHAARNNPGGAAAADTTIRQLLDIGSRRVLDTVNPVEPALQLDLSQLLAKLNLELDLLQPASRLAERSIALAEQLYGADSEQAAIAQAQQADGDHRAGHYAAAIERSRKVLAIAGRHGDKELQARARIVIGTSLFQLDYSKADEPQRHLEAALALLKELHAKTEDRSNAAYFLAWVMEAKGDYARAESLYADGIEAGRANFGPRSYIVAFGYDGLADMLRKQRRFAEARNAIREAISIYEFVLGPRHSSVAFAMTNWAMIEAAVGRRDEAVRLADNALAITRAVFGAGARQTVFPALQAARVKANRGDLPAAAADYEELLAALARSEPASSMTNRGTRVEYAELLIVMGRLDAARHALDEAQAGFDAADDRRSVFTSWLRVARAELALATGDVAAATEGLAHALDGIEAPEVALKAQARRIALVWARSRPEPAQAQAMLDALARYHALPAAVEQLDLDAEDSARMKFAVGRLLLAVGRDSDARAWLESAVDARERLDVPESPWLAEARVAAREATDASGRH